MIQRGQSTPAECYPKVSYMRPEGTMEYYTDQTRPAFLYVCYSFLLIFSKFCDLSLLHWPLGGGGGSTVRKNYGTALCSLYHAVGPGITRGSSCAQNYLWTSD
jgi:hypothetical protein